MTTAWTSSSPTNPGFRSRIAHHIDFPDYSDAELLQIADMMLWHAELSSLARSDGRALTDYIAKRREQPHFANARSIRNALDRARLRQANRIFAAASGPLSATELSEISAEDILASRVFTLSPHKRIGPP